MIVNPCDPFDPSGFLQWVLVLCCSHGCVKLLLISVILLTGQYFCPGLLHCPWCRCCIRCQRSVQDNRSHQIPWNRCVFVAKEVFKTTGVIKYLGTGVYSLPKKCSRQQGSSDTLEQVCIRCQRSVQDNRSHQIPWNRCVL